MKNNELTKLERLEKEIRGLKLEKLQLELQLLEMRKTFYIVEARKENDLVDALKKIKVALDNINKNTYLNYLMDINNSSNGKYQLERLITTYEYKTIVATSKILLEDMQKRINQRLEQDATKNEKQPKKKAKKEAK
jgi:hypothetical protein